MRGDKVPDLNNYAFKVNREYREQVAEICEKTGLSVSVVVNTCLGYGLEHLTIKPITRMGLGFDEKSA